MNSFVLVPKRLAEVAMKMTRIEAGEKKLLWGKIYFKSFSLILYGNPHLVFLHLSCQLKHAPVLFSSQAHISHLSSLTLSQDISLLALTCISVLSGSWK